MIVNFPCENCICLAICRHKLYTKLLEDCSLLRHCINVEAEDINGNLYMTIDIISDVTTSFRTVLQSYLNPTVWEVDENGTFTTLSKDLKR
jgi:hypothetical protein